LRWWQISSALFKISPGTTSQGMKCLAPVRVLCLFPQSIFGLSVYEESEFGPSLLSPSTCRGFFGPIFPRQIVFFLRAYLVISEAFGTEWSSFSYPNRLNFPVPFLTLEFSLLHAASLSTSLVFFLLLFEKISISDLPESNQVVCCPFCSLLSSVVKRVFPPEFFFYPPCWPLNSSGPTVIVGFMIRPTFFPSILALDIYFPKLPEKPKKIPLLASPPSRNSFFLLSIVGLTSSSCPEDIIWSSHEFY